MPKRLSFAAGIVALLILGSLITPQGRRTAGRLLDSLRVQKVQAVNADFSPFVDANANPALHQMVSQMISDKVDIRVNEPNQTVSDRSAASAAAGFPVQLIALRKDSPKLVVGGRHELNMTVDRSRLQEILKAAGHSEIVLPESLDGATFSVKVPRSVHAQFGICPGPITANKAITSQVIETAPAAGQFADCLRFSEGPSPLIDLPKGLDVQKLAEIGLEAAGMSEQQSRQFFRAIDWKSTLTLSVPRQLRSYEEVTVNGVKGTLLSLGGRRGPTYTLLWNQGSMSYSLTGFGDPGDAVKLADSLR
jgi:hypothetical protein